MEFAVQMTRQRCVDDIKQKLDSVVGTLLFPSLLLWIPWRKPRLLSGAQITTRAGIFTAIAVSLSTNSCVYCRD